jgi:hypothetical protein
MEKFRRGIEDLQKQEGVRTIKYAHMLGFLDPDLPKRGQRIFANESADASAFAGANANSENRGA